MGSAKHLLLAAVLLLTGCEKGVDLASGDHAPADNWQGQWRIINVWAEWCKPCWQEIPELNQFHALQSSELNQSENNIRLIGWNFDELQGEELKQIVDKMNIGFPVIEQWPQDWPKPEIQGVPATFIMAPDNSIKASLWGPQTLDTLHQALYELKSPVLSIDQESSENTLVRE